MLMQIDEAGSDDQALGADDSVGAQRIGGNARDLAAGNADIASGIKAGFRVEYTAAFDDEIVLLSPDRRRCQGKQAQSQETHGFSKSLGGYEDDAHRRWHIKYLAGVGQASGCRIDSEYDNVVRLLVCHKEKPTRWVDSEVARSLAFCWNMFNQLESSLCRIDCEHGDVIGPTIRSIEKPAGSVSYDLSGIILALEIFG